MAPPSEESESLPPGLAEPRTKEDWFAYVFYEPPPRPHLPPYDDYVTMDEDGAERRRLNRIRNRYHSALVLAWTPAVRHFETEITELLDANEMAPPGARLGLLIDGPPTVGKSTLVKMIGRKFEQDLREDFPERFAPERLGAYVPVVYISLTDQVTPKQISIAIARYLRVPTSGTKDTIDDRVLTALTACGTQLIIFDDLHFLDCSLKEGRASNDHIKFLANHAPCTIIGTGVDLEDSPLLSEGGPTGPVKRNSRVKSPPPNGPRTQTAGRFSRQELAPFALDSESEILQWVGVINSLHLLECQRRLDDLVDHPHRPGSTDILRTLHLALEDISGGYDFVPSLPDTDAVLHQRWHGHGGALSYLDDPLLTAVLIKIATMGGLGTSQAVCALGVLAERSCCGTVEMYVIPSVVGCDHGAAEAVGGQ